ncbi:MAG: ATP-binding protein [Chloroflexi bacterium]|nr:MAG: ATP-binding protein [Chloroflexota bacterium]
MLPLRNLDVSESRTYLLKRNIPDNQHEAFLNFTHGHPLALSLAADLFAQHSDVQMQLEKAPDIIKTLLEQLAQEVPTPHHRTALEACALVRVTTEGLLTEMLAVSDAHDLFEWLRGLSFLDTVQHGLFPHDLARDALIADLRWRNPDWYAELHRRARAYYMKRLEQSESREQRRVLLDYIYLHRDNPVVRPYFEWQENGTVFTDRMRAEEETAVLSMIANHEGATSARIAQLWLTLQPKAVTVFRDSTDKIQGVLVTLALEKSSSADRKVDPAISAAWHYLQSTAPLRAGERATYFRFWLAAETYQDVSPVQSRIFLNMVQHYLTTPGLAFTFIPCADPDFWADIFAYADLSFLPEANFETDGHQFGVYGHDWRAVPPISWLNLMAEREVTTTSPKNSPQSPEPLIILSQSNFAKAIRNALRDFHDTTALTQNPLLHSQLVVKQAGGQKDTDVLVHTLQSLIQETAASLQQTPRQAKFFRALHHTYFQPAPTQEKAAEVLDLPFSTYRRHLRSGIQYITERLWEMELNAVK